MPSKPQLVQQDFTAGIRRSRARDSLGRAQGANVLWDARDWIIGRLGVPLGKRGGWGYQGDIFPDNEEDPSWVVSMSNDPFNGGNVMRAIDHDLNIWYSLGPAFSTWVLEHDYDSHSSIYPAKSLPRQNGVFIADNLFFPSHDGTLLGSTHNEIYGKDWAMAADAGNEVIYLATHLNRLVGLDAHENLWFGNPLIDLAVWDEDAKYSIQQPGRGLISTGGELLVFCDGRTYKVKGSIPAGYGVTQDDISIELFAGDIGCSDAFSIVHWNTNAIWVDVNGVWITDGATYPMDLAWAGNGLDLFREFMENFVDRDTTRIACGINNNMLQMSMTEVSSGDFIDHLTCDLPRRVWSRQTNFPFTCYVRGALGQSETWAGVGTVVGRVAKISQIFSPDETNMDDADGTAVEPSFQTAYYRNGPQDGRFHGVWLGYEIEFAGDPPIAASDDFLFLIFSATTPGVGGNVLSYTLDFDSIHNGFGVVPVYDTSTHLQVSIPDDGSVDWVDIRDAVNALSGVITASITPGHEGDTSIGPNVENATLSGGLAATIDPVTLDVTYAVDPRADPDFDSYNNDLIQLEPKDIHGVLDPGYHWKATPVRESSAGLAVKVQQSGHSAKTSIHGIGLEYQPYPTFTER